MMKESCWCQIEHPLGSACGCWICPDCGRFYGCTIPDLSKSWFISPIDGKWIEKQDWKLPEYNI